MEIKKLTIIGLGLIGGSWGMALKRVKPEIEICGVDVDQEAIKIGQETRAIDWGTTDIVAGVADADMVVIATSIYATIQVIKRIVPYLKEGCILTDVASIKGNIVSAIDEVLPRTIYYIGGHPMAGSHSKGIIGADSYLFENAVYILTPTANTNGASLENLSQLVQALGAKVLYLSPEEHDLKVAAISHLPHVVASALVNSVGKLEEEEEGVLKLAAGGFRDITRIADSQPEMWRDIFLLNRASVLSMLTRFKEAITDLEEKIIKEEEEDLHQLLWQAKNWRSQVPAKIKGLLPKIYEIVVTVPDKPGMIGKISNILGNENINIMDIEILRVREGDGGSIRFGFQEERMAYQAVEILRKEGFIAKAIG